MGNRMEKAFPTVRKGIFWAALMSSTRSMTQEGIGRGVCALRVMGFPVMRNRNLQLLIVLRDLLRVIAGVPRELGELVPNSLSSCTSTCSPNANLSKLKSGLGAPETMVIGLRYLEMPVFRGKMFNSETFSFTIASAKR